MVIVSSYMFQHRSAIVRESTKAKKIDQIALDHSHRRRFLYILQEKKYICINSCELVLEETHCNIILGVTALWIFICLADLCILEF